MWQFKNTSNPNFFPQRIEWQVRDTLAVLIVPLIYYISKLGEFLQFTPMTISLIDTALRGIIFFILCYFYKQMLAQHWQDFKSDKWKSIIIIIVGAILLQICMTATRSILPVSETINHIDSINDQMFSDVTNLEAKQLFLLFVLCFGPLFTALIEDIIFRYTLLHKLFINNIIWRIFVVLINSILFGLIHFYNVDGNLLATVSFMSAGLFLNLIYIWTKNIWHVLLIHLLNNAVLSMGAIFLLAFMKLLARVQ